MSEIDFIGVVEVYRKQNLALAVALIIAIVLMAAVLVYALLGGHFALLVIFVPFGAALAAVRNSVAPTEMRSVPMSLAVADAVLRLKMSGARLFDGRYVDQYYLCEIVGIKFAGFDSDGFFRLSANHLESYAAEEGAVLDRRQAAVSDIVFNVDQTMQRKIEIFCEEQLRGKPYLSYANPRFS